MKRPALFGLIALKLAFTGLALWFIATRVELATTLGTLSTIDPVAVAAAGACALAQIWLASVRFGLVARMVGAPLRPRDSARITFIGGFFGQAFATFASGDAMRVWLFARRGAGYGAAASAVLLDRVFGIIALVVLIAIGLPALLDILPSAETRVSAVAVTAGSVLLLVIFVVLGRLLESAGRGGALAASPLRRLADLPGAARFLFAAPNAAAGALALGMAAHLLSVGSIYLLFGGMGSPASLVSCFLLIPFVLLIVMLPISFAGWGLREGAMVAGFAMVGMPADVTLAVSIAFGLLVLLASLPGLILWLRERMPDPPPEGPHGANR